MEQRVIVLNRDVFAHGRADGACIFVGQDHGRSVRVAVPERDWSTIKARAGSLERALGELERMAALAPDQIEDGFGGYLVPVSLHN